MDLVTTKVVAMSILGCVSLLIGFAPLKLSRIMGWSGTGRHSKRKDAITSVLLCFGGGVLLSTSMIHMLPEVRKGIKYANSKNVSSGDYGDHEDEVPYAEIILCCGFLLVYFIEEIVLAVATKEEENSPLQRTFSMRASRNGVGKRPIAVIGNKASNDAEENEKDVTVDKENNDFKRASTRKAKSARNPKKDSNIEAEEAIENRLSGSSAKDEVDVIADVANITNENGSKDAPNPIVGGSIFDQLNSESPSGYNPKYEGRLKRSGAESMFPNYHPTHENQKMQKSLRRNKLSLSTTCTSLKGFLGGNCVCLSCSKSVTDGNTDNASDQICFENCGPGRLRDFITVLSLSFHSIFEGLAVGLESTTGNVWKLFAAIATHKFVITFCIGLELVGSGNQQAITTCAYIIYMVTFILVSPLGIAIGIAISELSGIGSQDLENGVLELSESSNHHHIVISILQGLAAGTILYIVVFEVLLREKSKRVPGLLQFIFIVLGFVIMLLINIYVGNIDNENEKNDKSFNPEILHPEVHFHPTHLHNGHLDNVQFEEEESNSINGYDDTSYGDNNTDYTLYNESYTTYDAVDLDNNG